MRQRLLLVAGWLAAAIGSGIVASGAVAVAGGQVLDRPLRPFTAAEVAALPVVRESTPVDVEPHASGGIDHGDVPPDGSAAVEPDEPSGAGGSSADPVGGAAEEPSIDVGADVDPIGPNAPSVVRIATSAGGQASFVATTDGLVLLWATPAAGFVAQTVSIESTTISVRFSSSLTVWVIEASMADDEIIVDTRTEPIT